MTIIYFRSDKELIYFCEIIFRTFDEINVKWHQNKHWGNELLILNDQVSINDVIDSMIEVFNHFRLDAMLREIAKGFYYYSDDAEVDHICQLTKNVLADRTIAKRLFHDDGNLPNLIRSILKEQLTVEKPIYFDALITFCMKPLTSCLREAVGYGIDEMKREEEYQTFIESVRSYISKREPKIDMLYIVQERRGAAFRFYKPDGGQYSKHELNLMMHQEPLYMIGLDENEFEITPVISLLPRKIYIFGPDPTEAKIIALISLFQESVRFYPLKKFPFSAGIK